ncbi:hypothetical protein BU23DRAFT_599681 [Bimuria novae-zelandiae CBS 107.79]|uniref:Uncharacterized protein n=1 Tax=Bimuria novae-zelandiae CBS 107.79 TaxID=1447943 RepID=A0A6A5V5N3_9PLEO|nr:hypothetical protein BU23DRAFT_599681 [Bimuria novae-zelandiae CBS 107.79]
MPPQAPFFSAILARNALIASRPDDYFPPLPSEDPFPYAPAHSTPRVMKNNLRAGRRRVDAFDCLHEELSVAKSKAVTRAVMASGDARRVRKIRKACLRAGKVRRKTTWEYLLLQRESVEQGVILGSPLGVNFVFQGWPVKRSRLPWCESSSPVGGVEGVENEGLKRKEERFWGGYVRLGDGVLDQQRNAGMSGRASTNGRTWSQGCLRRFWHRKSVRRRTECTDTPSAYSV